MAKSRTKIPAALAAEVLHANRHTCCACQVPRLPVEIHHVNENPADNRWENLAVLCRNCHGVVSDRGPLGRRYSQSEVRKLKDAREALCEGGGADDEPEHEDHEVTKVAGDAYVFWTYELSADALMVVSIDADVAVSTRIARQSDFRRWCNDEETEISEENEDAYVCTLTFEAPTDNRYVVWVENDEDEDAVVEIDTTIWSPKEDDEDDEGDDE